jgi:hypothetical protein
MGKQKDSSEYKFEIVVSLLEDRPKSAYTIAGEWFQSMNQSPYRRYSKMLKNEGFLRYTKGKYELNYNKLVDYFFEIQKNRLKSEPTKKDKETIIKFLKCESFKRDSLKGLKNAILENKNFEKFFSNYLHDLMYLNYNFQKDALDIRKSLDSLGFKEPSSKILDKLLEENKITKEEIKLTIEIKDIYQRLFICTHCE